VKGTLLGLALFAAAPAFAQQPRGTEEQLRIRYQIGVMERVLEQAVQLGAQITGQQMLSLMPNVSLFAGPARARGFKLDGYGMFFDIEVPALRRSLTWSIRTLNQPDISLTSALKSLRDHIESIGDRAARSNLEQALRQLELQAGLPPAPPEPAAAANRPAAMTVASGASEPAPPQAPPTAPPYASDPGDAYTAEVKRALIDAMLDHSGPISVGPDEWLTVAARDNEERLAPGDMYEVLTILLRIRGSDLAAFRADRLSRDEARARVEVREF
jgi:hypothetical protein